MPPCPERLKAVELTSCCGAAIEDVYGMNALVLAQLKVASSKHCSGFGIMIALGMEQRFERQGRFSITVSLRGHKQMVVQKKLGDTDVASIFSRL